MLKALRQKKARLVADGRAIIELADAENRDITAEEKAKIEKIEADLKAVNEQIAMRERIADQERSLNATGGDELTVPDNARVQVGREGHERDPKHGFKDITDFCTAVMKAEVHGRVEPRLSKFSASRYEAAQGSDEQGTYSDPHGGFLIPTTVMPGVLSLTPEDDPIAPLVTPVPMTSPKVVFNARVDKNHSTSVSGGFTVTRRPETVDGTSSRGKFEPIEVNAHELFGLAFATEVVLADSPVSFFAVLQAGFRDEFSSNAIRERLSGTGVGEPLGVLKSDCLIAVAKEAGQEADTIVTENLDKMVARCWKFGRAVWLANQNTIPQLAALVRVVGTGGAPIPYFRPAEGEGGVATLYGRPCYFTEHCESIGDQGDLVLGNWSQYLEGTYQPMQQAESIHVRFISNERAFKFWLRNDGQPWWKAALQPKKGSTLSPFVTLAAR